MPGPFDSCEVDSNNGSITILRIIHGSKFLVRTITIDGKSGKIQQDQSFWFYGSGPVKTQQPLEFIRESIIRVASKRVCIGVNSEGTF